MKVVLAYSAAVDFKEVPPQVIEIVKAIPGWLQSRINEGGNKFLRDAERKDNSSKAVFPLKSSFFNTYPCTIDIENVHTCPCTLNYWQNLSS
jgi:hypothetical protein